MKPKPSDKLLLALQFWSGDRAQAIRLAEFIADLQPSHSVLADMLLVSRFDCPHSIDLVKYLSRKFNTYHFVCRRRGIGWPIGCNELFFGTVEWAYHKMEAGQIPNYKAVFTFEADCVPLSSNWISHFSHQWDVLNNGHRCYVAGARLESPGEHINGNMLLSGDLKFMHWLSKKVGGCPSKQGWDYYLAPAFKQWGWGIIPGMESYWQKSSFTDEEFQHELLRQTIWMHGVKDDSLLQLSRKHLLGV